MNQVLPCKEYTGCRNRGGYGVVRHGGRPHLAHRAAYCEFHGIPIEQIKGLVIRHECDNRACIEPTHLRIGTQADNVRDMMDRGRNSPPPRFPGSTHAMAKLSYEDVKAIRLERRNGALNKDLAKKYGVTPTAIGLIVRNRTWNDPVCEINARIAPLSITADGLASLGFQPVGKEGAARLYAEADMGRICAALIQVIERAQFTSSRRAA